MTSLNFSVDSYPQRELPHGTHSLCHTCYGQGITRVVPARLEEEAGGVSFVKRCPEHGELHSHLWNEVEHFTLAQRLRYGGVRPLAAATSTAGCPHDCGLCPQHESRTGIALLEVTDGCDLGCPVCFASAPRRSDAGPALATLEAQLATLRRANDDRGPTTLQLIGGEPTLRDDLPALIAMGHRLGFGWIQLATNGLRLAEDTNFVLALGDAGLRTLYLQFDSLRDAAVVRLRGRSGLVALKQQALTNAAVAGIDRNVLTMVVARGVNDQHVGEVLDFAVTQRQHVQGVVLQPLARVGRFQDLSTPRYGMSDLMGDVERQTGGRIRPRDWLPYSVYTPLVRYFLAHPLEHEAAAEITADPHCALHVLLVFDDEGNWRPLGDYLDPIAAAEHLRSALALAHEPQGRLAELAASDGAPLSEHERRLLSRQLVGSLVLAAMGQASTGRSLDRLLSALRQHATHLLGGDVQLLEFLSRARGVMLVAAMDFMDAETLDLERLRRCTVHYATREGPVPFCAYNLMRRPGAAACWRTS